MDNIAWRQRLNPALLSKNGTIGILATKGALTGNLFEKITRENTYNGMIQNLIWATGYYVVAIPLAAGVLCSTGFGPCGRGRFHEPEYYHSGR